MNAGFLEPEDLAAAPTELIIGPTFTGFLDRVAPPGSAETLTTDATAILGAANVQVDVTSKQTGLVVGRVQSGKTLSYESVIALARDNGFALVIVVSGISNPLLNQGVNRLRGDLTSADRLGWNFLVNAGSETLDASNLAATAHIWREADSPKSLRKTAVCLLLKNHGRIDKFVSAIRDIDWTGLKVLIIDDEADQASLNTLGKRHKVSATYKQLLEMRGAFPHHAYLQYTATPQAPLLVAINDILSPDFVRVIEPGPGYVGGPDYFEQTSKKLVRVIDEADLEMADDPNGTPPESLLTSFRLFIVGSAAVLTQPEPSTRSMLIHPSRVTAPHATFVRWIRRRTEFWLTALEDEEYAADIRAEFLKSWRDLEATDPDLPAFEECWPLIRFVLRGLQVVEMNAREGTSTPVIEWDNTRAYVLVGGQALDRGFTVEGLAVTYMPRGPGVWNADSIQQRARFFGYKRSYLGQCRVFLDPLLRDAFVKYVQHERHMLDSLTAIQNGRESLKAWERQFYLDPAMRATRQSVISIPMIKVDAGQRWIFDPTPVFSKAEGENAVRALDRFLQNVNLEISDFGHARGLITVKLALELLESLPTLADSKLPNIRGLKLQLAKLTDDDSERISLLYMRPGDKTERTVTTAGAVQPFQGASRNYPGDRTLSDPDLITLQLHTFAVRTSKNATPYAEMVVPAFWIPERLAGGWLLEEGGE